MFKPSQKARKLAPVLLILPLAACATPTQLTKGGALDAFKPLRNSAKAPCEMQRDVAGHNSVYDSLKTGKDVTYKAPCDIDKSRIASVEQPKDVKP